MKHELRWIYQRLVNLYQRLKTLYQRLAHFYQRPSKFTLKTTIYRANKFTTSHTSSKKRLEQSLSKALSRLLWIIDARTWSEIDSQCHPYD